VEWRLREYCKLFCLVLLASICFFSNPFPPLLCCRGGISNETDLFFCSEDYTPVLILFFTIPSKSRPEQRVTAAVIRFNLADAERRLKVSNEQLSDVRRELDDAKTQLTDTQITLLGTLDDLSAQQSQISSLRNDRDNVPRALNLTRDLLNPTFPAFSLDTGDLLPSVESFASSVPARLTDQHLRAAEKRDDFRDANKEYADEIRALRAEHFACVRQLTCLTAENLQLRAEIDSLRPPASA
jgi:chromosome segregation ATPase